MDGGSGYSYAVGLLLFLTVRPSAASARSSAVFVFPTSVSYSPRLPAAPLRRPVPAGAGRPRGQSVANAGTKPGTTRENLCVAPMDAAPTAI